jgi:hypothetical protein
MISSLLLTGNPAPLSQCLLVLPQIGRGLSMQAHCGQQAILADRLASRSVLLHEV